MSEIIRNDDHSNTGIFGNIRILFLEVQGVNVCLRVYAEHTQNRCLDCSFY